jgi:membrane protease subunit HflK
MVVENATGNASRFDQVVAAYGKAPAVTRDRMYIDTMQQIFTNTSKVMVDSRAGNPMIYLPLDKLISQNAGNEGVGSKSGPVQLPQSAPPTDVMQALDSVRSRDDRARDSSRDRESR